MCVVSMIMDDYRDRWKRPWELPLPTSIPPVQPYPSGGLKPFTLPEISREEFNELKAEIEALKELIKAAKKYDEATGQPDCEMDEKVAMIKSLAKALGVDMEDVFG